MLRTLADLLFPPRCVGCERHGPVLCAACRRDLKYLHGVCQRCALPRRSGDCRGCERLSPALRSLRAVCAYEGVARSAVHALKYRGGRLLAAEIGGLMRGSLARQPLRAELLVAVPMAASRGRERGFNQAELLAAQIVDGVGGVLADKVLERASRPAQQGLSAAERARNLEGAIRAQTRLNGESVLLVDDVATTGATLSACADALMAAGARTVSALVFARDL